MRKTPHSGSDVHLAAKRPKKGNDNASVASSSAVQPAAPGADLIEKVQNLGHYPQRFKKAETDEQKAENSLAEKISKAWAKLPEDAKLTLAAVRQEKTTDAALRRAQTTDNEILKAVRQLGHYPLFFKKPTTDEQKLEMALADKIYREWAKLPEETREELQRLKTNEKDERIGAKETALLERLRAFGKWPQECASSKSRDSELQRELAHDIRKKP
jgi:hypothetical protein